MVTLALVVWFAAGDDTMIELKLLMPVLVVLLPLMLSGAVDITNAF